jgi:high affinity Mn2+ porin
MRANCSGFWPKICVATLACLPWCVPAHAQATSTAQTTSTLEQSATSDASSDPDPMLTMVPHLETDRLWLSGQANFISQWHQKFHSPYSGRNSLSAQAQDATSRVLTLFTGLRLSSTTELLCDVQETGGHGLGEVLGVAGFTNLDVVRNPTLSKAPYIARLMWHQIVPLSRYSASCRSGESRSASAS